MRNYIVPVLVFLLIFISLFLIVRNITNPNEAVREPTPTIIQTSTPSATLAPAVIRDNRTTQPAPTPIIIHEKETEKETVREVPQSMQPTPQPMQTSTPQPSPQPTDRPTPTPRIPCVLGICVDLP